MSILEFPYSDLDHGDPIVEGVHHTGVTGSTFPGTPPTIHVDGDYRYVEFNATDLACWFSQTFTAANAVSVAAEIELVSNAEAVMEMFHFRNASSKQGNLLVSTGRAMTLRNAADANASAAPAIALATKHILRVGAKVGATTSDGHYLYRLSRSDDDTTVHTFSSTAQNAGTANLTEIRVGDFATTTDMRWRIGRLRIATGTDALDGSGNLVAIDPLTVAPETPALYLATSGAASVPAELYYATSSSTSVRVDIA